MSSMML